MQVQKKIGRINLQNSQSIHRFYGRGTIVQLVYAERSLAGDVQFRKLCDFGGFHNINCSLCVKSEIHNKNCIFFCSQQYFSLISVISVNFLTQIFLSINTFSLNL